MESANTQLELLKHRIIYDVDIFGSEETYNKVLENLLEDSKYIALSIRFPFQDYSNLTLPTKYNNWQLREDLETKDQKIAELEQQLANSIRPKFNRQEHMYSFSFGKIKEFVVVAYLDNNITLCEDTTTSKLEWCDNNFLVLTKQEAELKLKELKGE
mgnify:CR=1 FL=1